MEVVTDDEAGLRLDRWVRRRHPAVTQGVLQRLCRTGQIRVDGKRADAATRVLAGQSVRLPPLPPPGADRQPRRNPRDIRELASLTLYEDDHLLVLDKPSGLASQGGPGILRHVDGMLASLRDDAGRRPLLVHRLDRDTSGVMLLAKGPANAAKLAALFRSRDMHKIYWAVVIGRPSPSEGVIDAPLARLGGGAGAITILAERDDEDAAAARTEYRTLDAAGRRLTWLELSPLTGRTHQLRVHCNALGHPILADPKYGGEVARLDGFSARLHLHARSIEFPHPVGGTLVVRAGLPPHMRETFKRLGFEVPRESAILKV